MRELNPWNNKRPEWASYQPNACDSWATQTFINTNSSKELRPTFNVLILNISAMSWINTSLVNQAFMNNMLLPWALSYQFILQHSCPSPDILESVSDYNPVIHFHTVIKFTVSEFHLCKLWYTYKYLLTALITTGLTSESLAIMLEECIEEIKSRWLLEGGEKKCVCEQAAKLRNYRSAGSKTVCKIRKNFYLDLILRWTNIQDLDIFMTMCYFLLWFFSSSVNSEQQGCNAVMGCSGRGSV